MTRFHLFAAAGALAATTFASAPTALAQDTATRVANGARFGAWTVSCEAIAVNETVCVLSQRLVATEGQTFLAEFLAFNDAEEPVAYIAARVPNGVHFPSGLSLRGAEADEPLAFVWQNCSAELCEAILAVDAEVLGRIDIEAGAVAGYRPRPGAEPRIFRLATNGLGEGLAALAKATGAPGVAAP